MFMRFILGLCLLVVLLTACAHIPARLVGGSRCSADEQCASRRCVLQRCIAVRGGAFDAPCDADWQCSSARCKDEGRCGLGQLGDGEPCNSHDLCQSSVCDMSTGMCFGGPDNRGGLKTYDETDW